MIAFYSVIWALGSYARLFYLLVSDPILSGLPAYQRFYLYFLPGLHLFAGVALFLLKKGAFPLYAAYFVALLAVPVVVSTVYGHPYLPSNWFEIYKRTAQGIMGVGWLVALLVASYAGYLYRRGVLK